MENTQENIEKLEKDLENLELDDSSKEAQKPNLETSTNSSSSSKERFGFHKKDDMTEYFDEEEVFLEKVKKAAKIIKESKYLVCYTGAGVSTAAKICDYRGPQGLWTLMEKGVDTVVPLGDVFESAQPTFSHRAITELHKRGLIQYLVTTNIDSLHRKADFPVEVMSELHGNVFIEKCEKCKIEYFRKFDVRNDKNLTTGNHFTGRNCEKCNGKLKDNIIQMNEFLEDENREKGSKAAWKSDAALVLGSSMRVAPANSLPGYSYRKNGGSLLLCNLQKTPFDKDAAVRIFQTTDKFLEALLKELDIHL